MRSMRVRSCICDATLTSAMTPQRLLLEERVVGWVASLSEGPYSCIADGCFRTGQPALVLSHEPVLPMAAREGRLHLSLGSLDRAD